MQNGLLKDVYCAYYGARKHKRNTVNQLKFELDLEKNLQTLHHDILYRTYEPRPCVAFIVEKPVKREVFAADFRDRVVHHLIFNYLNPVLDGRFVYDSYSCRTGKGTLFGIRRLEHHMRSCSQNHRQPCYVMKMDVEGYFMRMDRRLLWTLLQKHIEKAHKHWQAIPLDVLFYLLEKTIFIDPTQGCIFKTPRSLWNGLPPSKSLFHSPEGCGLPIGNLTSQLFSNVYLHELDTFVEYRLRCKHYGRYVDDFYLLSNTPVQLLEWRKEIERFLSEQLHLRAHPRKFYLQHYSKGVAFLGVVVYPWHTSIGKRIRKNYHAADPDKKIQYHAIFMHHNAYKIMNTSPQPSRQIGTGSPNTSPQPSRQIGTGTPKEGERHAGGCPLPRPPDTSGQALPTGEGSSAKGKDFANPHEGVSSRGGAPPLPVERG